MLKTCGIAGLFLWIVGTTVIAVAMNWGVRSEPVELHLADGTTIHGTLYQPTKSAGDLPAALVLHGAAVAHQSCAPGLALPLVDDGFLVLAIDLAGHGGSAGLLRRDELDFPLGHGDASADYPEVVAGIEFLQHHPLFSKGHITTIDNSEAPGERVRLSRLTLVGHSLGGLVATRAAYNRADVDSVVCIGAAPDACDLTHPRNLLILSGRKEEYCRFDQCIDAIHRATGGAIQQQDAPFGEFKRGTARRLLVLNDVTHLSELANPSISRSVAEWVSSSVDSESKKLHRYRLVASIIGLLAATLGGVMAATWLIACLADKFYLRPQLPRPWSVRTLALLFVAIAAVVLLVAQVARRLEFGPAYFVGPTVGLFSGVAVCIATLSFVVRSRCKMQPRLPWIGLFWRNAALGAGALCVGIVWLGVPWGMSWVALIPSPTRLALALALCALLFPWSMALAAGFSRLVGDEGTPRRVAPMRGLIWLAIPATLWLSNALLPSSTYPLFLIPVRLFAASFVIPLPLWLLRDREGLGIARGVCHAGGAAWIFACHFPFVSS